ncbi:hypothetical protein ACJZ2D_014941 [Fusarium nematophilum]
MAPNGGSSSKNRALPSSYRQPSVETQHTDDEDGHQRQHEQQKRYGREVHDDFLSSIEDEKIKHAMIDSRKAIVEGWLSNELTEATEANLESFRKSLSTKEQISEISVKVNQNLTPLGAKRKNSTDIANLLHSHPEILNFFIEKAFDQFVLAGESTKREQREEIERLLNVKNQNGSYYEILGVPDNASRSELVQRSRVIMKRVHSDKNDDESANECFIMVRDASQVLLDKAKRQNYDRSIAGKPKSKGNNAPTHGESWAPGAFSKGIEPDDDDDTDNDDSKEKEKNIPDIPKEVKHIHSGLGKYVQSYFSNFEREDEKAVHEIQKKNSSIKKLNRQGGREANIYLADMDVFSALRSQQLRVVSNRMDKKTDSRQARKELSVLENMYYKSAIQRSHQWPEGWVDFIEKAVQQKLDEINRNEPDQDEEAGKTDEDINMGEDGSSVYSDDSAMAELESMSLDGAPLSPTRSQPRARSPPPARPLQMLRKGYTLLGDRILGYRVLSGWNKIMGQEVIRGFKFLVETEEPSLFKVVRGTEIGDQAAHAYHNLPEGEKNDVGKSLEAFGKARPEDYRKLTRVGWVKTLYDTENRFPETWLCVEMQDGPNNVKEHFVHRTALRQLMSHANKLIDSFCVDNGIQPPWATTSFPDPSNDFKYMALEFPPPRRRARQNYRRPSRLAIESYRERPMLEMESHQDRKGMGIDEGNGTLVNLLEQLTLMMKVEKEERQRDRAERQRDKVERREEQKMMRSLLKLRISDRE